MSRGVRLALGAGILVELAVLVGVGYVIGGWWTFGLVLASTVVGSILLKAAGRRALETLRASAAEQRPPDRSLGNAALTFAGGILMVVPGLVSSLLGVLVAIPLTWSIGRKVLTWAITRGAAKHLAGAGVPDGFFPGAGGGPGAGTPGAGTSGAGTSGSGTVIQGDVISSRDSRYTGLRGADATPESSAEESDDQRG